MGTFFFALRGGGDNVCVITATHRLGADMMRKFSPHEAVVSAYDLISRWQY